MSSIENVALSDELLERINSLFDTSAQHVSEASDISDNNRLIMSRDLRRLMPELPNLAENNIEGLDSGAGNTTRSRKIYKSIGNLVFKKTLLSEDFAFDSYTQELEKIESMAVTKLRAQRRSYIGSVAIGNKKYEISKNASVYDITKTVWTDYHGSKVFDLTLITPDREILSNLDESSAFSIGSLSPKTISTGEKQIQISNLDNALRTFNY